MSLFPTEVRTRGLTEFVRDCKKLSKALGRELDGELRKLAGPAAEAIRQEAAGHRFSERSISGIRAGSRRGGAVVRQSRGKVTGKRADFGSTEYRLAFLPGAERARPQVEQGVEEWLGRITAAHGLGEGGLL